MNNDHDDVKPPEDGKIIVLIKAVNNKNKPFYSFIEMTISHYKIYKTAKKRNAPIDLANLGTIIASDWGHQVSDAVFETIEQKHGTIISDEH